MAEHKETETGAMHQLPKDNKDNAVVLRIPKPNMQVTVLGLIAFITLFQTFQLVRISGVSNTAVKTAPAAATQTSAGGGAGSNATVPQSMVGGC